MTKQMLSEAEKNIEDIGFTWLQQGLLFLLFLNIY